MTTNAERQAAYRERMRKAGFVQTLIWIQPDKKQALKAFAAHLRKAKPGKW